METICNLLDYIANTKKCLTSAGVITVTNHYILLCSRDVAIPVQSRICFLKFHDRDSVSVAQHLTNTVFIDRALIIIPFTLGDMPDEQRAMEILGTGGSIPGIGPETKWPAHVTNQVCGCEMNGYGNM